MEPVNTNNSAKNVGIASAIGAVALATTELIVQKKILAKPDEFITKVKGKAAAEARYMEPFFMGTKENSEAALKQLQNKVDGLVAFAKGGKLNFKIIAKMGAIGAGIGALTVLGGKALRALAVKMGVESKKIERDVVTNPEANKAISDINKATNATSVQIV
ncbi:MAG: hypothetical protein IKU37_03075 [Candidatus Gastranaerophilales bacterium]|nr:hypothetical protein [Candidatus Gastranaerophilales bacterium]